MVVATVLGRHLVVRGSPIRHFAMSILLLGLASPPAVAADTHMLIVAGLGGEPAYATAFAEQAQAAAQAAESADVAVTLLSGPAARREAIRDALADIAAVNAPDSIVLQLIGHGTYDNEHYRFNVPGPDPTADDLAGWMESVPAARQLVVVATSASGAAVERLQAEGRTIIAATRDGQERNAVEFGGYWTAALGDSRADVDKDGRIDADEAFRFAEQAVVAHYEERQRIATEHPRLDGAAGRFVLAAIGRGASSGGRRDALLEQIDDLKAAKAEQREEDYFVRLQELLLELAALERQTEGGRAEGGRAEGER